MVPVLSISEIETGLHLELVCFFGIVEHYRRKHKKVDAIRSGGEGWKSHGFGEVPVAGVAFGVGLAVYVDGLKSLNS